MTRGRAAAATLAVFGGTAVLVAPALTGQGSTPAAGPQRVASVALMAGEPGGLELAIDGKPVTTTTPPATTSTTAPTTTTTMVPADMVVIARYGFEKPLYAGTDETALRAGPAWNPASVAPGATGRAVIAVPFDLSGLRPLDELEVGERTFRVFRIGRDLDPATGFASVDRPEVAVYQSIETEGGQPFALAYLTEVSDG
ncbi:MAG: hypothetical protein S0880_07360 [Actinomycetota bacterium]|nr:hypothetical protein [Actinomycetota bacterium]